MITNIKEISFFAYLTEAKLQLGPLGSYHVRHSLTKDGILLGAYLAEEIVGMAVLEFAPRPVLTYVFVAEKLREQGIGTQLVQAALTLAIDRGVAEVSSCVIAQNEYGQIADGLLRKTGFSVAETATIIRYANDERCKRNWNLFREQRGECICNALAKRGFRTLPFSEVSSEILDRLEASIGSDFAANLDPFRYISNINDRLVPEYSFVTLKNNEPVAFVTVTTVDDNTLVFQQLSTGFKYQGNGIFLLPFTAFMEKFLTGSYSKVSAMILDRNERMISLVQSFIGSMAESLKTQSFYLNIGR